MDAADCFRNLLLMAASDGRMTEAELRLLLHRAAEWGISDDQFEDAIHDALHGQAMLTLPDEPAQRIEVLKDLIRMMAADGRLDRDEKALFALASAALGIDAEALNQMIDTLLEEEL
jgi:uncharacterized tellurite resistance protein B-like protein